MHEMPTVRLSIWNMISSADAFHKLIPLLLRVLDLPDADIRGNVIDTFIAVAEGESPEKNMVQEHSATLVNLMLKNGKVEETPLVVNRFW